VRGGSSALRVDEVGAAPARRFGRAAPPIPPEPSAAPKRSARLSGKERKVLHELARGRSTDDIAATMFVSPHTVRTHIKNGMRKLEARTRAHAVAIAMGEGAIEFDPAG
jgi:DNA-binding CsgD family transcriptional regulator